MDVNKEGILDVLEKSKGYETALLTTFNFEIDFFEKAILNRLLRNDIRKISVFVDSKELTKALEKAHPGSLGQRYVVNPVYINASFHPKVILLLGKRKARLIVSSANLKLSGYCINNEVFDYIDYDEDHPQYRGIIADSIRFFENCNLLTPGLDEILLKEVHKLLYNRKVAGVVFPCFLENTEHSILKQAADFISEPIRQILVAVPYYDNTLKALETIHSLFPSAAIHLYLQHEKSTFPENLAPSYINSIRVFEEVTALHNPNGHFYHGKVYLFKGELHSYVLYGSSNCTMSALTKSRTDGGNIEANLLVTGMPEEFDDFFEQFPVIAGRKPDSQIMSYKTEPSTNYYFKYGVAERNIILHIGYLKEFSPEFFLNTKSLPWKKIDQEIVIETNLEISDSIFDISVRYDGHEESIRCWYINREILELNRISSSEEKDLQDSEDFGIGEKFLSDYEKLLKQMDCCKADFLNTKQLLSSISTASGLLEETEAEIDSEGEDAFIINVELSDADYAAYRNYKIIERLRNRMITRYLSSSSLSFNPSTSSQKIIGEIKEDIPVSDRERRKATPEEKRFERFVKRCIRGMLDEEFVEIITVDHYFGLLVVIFDIFRKYTIDEKVEGIFTDEYVINTRCALLTFLLTMPLSDWEYREYAIAMVFDLLLINHNTIRNLDSIEVQGELEQKNRRLLLRLNEKFNIRESFVEYLKMNFANSSVQDPLESRIAYIDKLFGYKTLSQIQGLVKRNLGKNSALVPFEAGSGIYVLVYTENPGRYLKPDTTIIRELAKYSSYVSKITTIIFDFQKQKPRGSDPVKQVKHKINLERRNWSYSIVRGNGFTKEYPSSYLAW